jgi:diaminopimelate decarboxylase
MWTFEACHGLALENGSPFYVFDRDKFIDNYRTFERAFHARYDRIQIGYSYKTNYVPYVCRLVKELGGHAEVVSRLEYDLARRVGQDPGRIIFNGPLKREEDVEVALLGGAMVNLDSWYELDHLRAFASKHPAASARIGLRINVDLSDDEGASHVQEGLPVGRFGFSPESIRHVIPIVSALGFHVRALHGHTSSRTRSPWIYERITRTLCHVAEEHFANAVEFIDIGGGFYGKMPPGFAPPGAATFDDYAQVIVRALEESLWARTRRPCLVLEPGVALAADAMSFVTRVLDVKEIGGRVLAVVDGSILNVKPTMNPRNQPYRAIRASGAARRSERLLSVVGATCMEKDYLLKDVVCDVEPGDYLAIDNVGAYSLVMTPPFIHPAPAIVTRDRGTVLAIRERQTFDQVFGAYLF